MADRRNGSMRAARFRREHDRGVMELGAIERREPEPSEVRLRVEACGICGTDLHWYAHGLMPPGHTPGHEMIGRITDLGSDAASDAHFEAAGLGVGSRVAVEPLRSCGRCRACLAGRDSICPETRLYGLHLPGGLAESICVPAHRVFPLEEDLPAAVAALAEPMAVAVHGLARGHLAAGERVLILGSGAVGLVTLVAARALGAGEVWTTARYPAQAELARALGAHRVLSEEEGSASSLAQESRRTDFDLVVETVGGQAPTLVAAAAAARPGGRVSVLGVFLGAQQIDPIPLLMKEVDLHWSNCYQRAPAAPSAERTPSDFDVAIRLIEREREALARLTTHQLPLEDVGKAFDIAANKHSGAVKVTVLIDEATPTG